jgi:spore coat polysaccharide biosynthesis protein SpsF
MLRTLGIIEAPRCPTSGSDCRRRRLAGKSVLEWVVRRITDCQRLDGVIVVAGASDEDRDVCRSVPPDVPVFTSKAGDSLKRVTQALDEYPAEAIVLVRVDWPFIDPNLIDRLVTTADANPACDYISYCLRDGQPAILSFVGVFAEWCKVKALRKAERRAADLADRQNVTRYVYSHPEDFCIRLIPAPDQLDREDVRLKVDHEEDWDNLQDIYEALGPDGLEWQRVVRLLDGQPALRERMAALNREVSVR